MVALHTRLMRYLLVIASLIMCIHVLIYIAFGVSLIPFPYDYDQAEGFELNNAILFSQGDCPYCDNNTFPFYASGYTPFFHLLMVPFVWVFGPHYWYGRLIIFLATFATAGLIYFNVRQSGRSKLIPLIFAFGFLASNYIYHIGPLLRQHLLMVFLEALAVTVAVMALRTQKINYRLLGVAFFCLLLAGYTKQLAYSTCIAVFLWLLIRNPRTSLIYASGLGISAGIIYAIFFFITDGQWHINIVASNQNPYITEQFVGLFEQFVRLHWPILVIAGAYTIFNLYRERLSLISIWFIVSLVSTIGAGKWGAGDSYFATTLVATLILAGIATTRLWEQRHDQGARIGALLAILLMIVYGLTVIKFPTSGPIFEPIAKALNIRPTVDWRYPLYDSAGWTVGYAVTGHFPSESDYESGAYITEKARMAEGFILSEDASFTILAGKQVVTNPVQLYNLWENNLWNPSNLLAMLEAHEFGLIILRARFLPPPVISAIERYYEISETVAFNGFEYELWVPAR